MWQKKKAVLFLYFLKLQMGVCPSSHCIQTTLRSDIIFLSQPWKYISLCYIKTSKEVLRKVKIKNKEYFASFLYQPLHEE